MDNPNHSNMTTKPPRIIPDGNATRLPAATALHGEIFKTDPAIQYMLHDMPTAKRTAYIPTYIGTLLGGAALNGATFDEAWTHDPPADDPAAPPACSAVWLPPGRSVENLRTILSAEFVRFLWQVGVWRMGRMMREFQVVSDRAKKGALGKAGGKGLVEFHYLWFVGTAVEERGRGLAAALIGRYQESVVKEGKGRPIWLESSTERSRRLYERLGFRIVKGWVLGKGVVNGDGFKEKGGDGVPIWAMIWWPPKVEKEVTEGNGVS